MKLQVTLFDENKKYKPVSTIVEIENMEYYETHKREVQTKAIGNICHIRRWTYAEMKKLGYTQLKVRDYELAQRVELLKKLNKERGN